MPRNSGGSYSLPGTPFIPGTIISSNEVNTKFLDISTALTDSLSRSGAGGMLAPLGLPDGSVGVPSLTWNTDSTTGFYLAAPGDIRLVSAAATIQRWTLTAVEVNRPLTVLATTANSTAVTATGTGTGAGGTFTGGSTNGVGVVSTGTGTGAGVAATGGPNSGPGLTGTGGAANGVGALGTGAGTGAGVRGVGGPSGGDGLIAIGGGTAGRGVNALGAPGQAGGLFTAGTAATSTVPQMAVRVAQGYVTFEATTSPASNVAITNALTPRNIDKVQASLTIQSSAVTIVDGQNIASAVVVGGSTQLVRITFASTFAAANYQVALTPDAGASGANMFAPGFTNKTPTTLDIRGYILSTGAAIDFSGATIYRVDVRIGGVQ